MSKIHPSAVIEDGAVIGEDCEIGPFCHIGPKVKIGNRNKLQSHVVLDNELTMGDDNELFSFACLGKITQDLKFTGDPSFVEIGNGNTFREYVTIHTATAPGVATRIGDNCNILAYSHVAHDCIVGNNVIISSSVMIAGHVEIGDYAIINGMSGAVQFLRIGKGAFIGGFTKITQEILPYCIADGMPAVTRAVNKIGMERRGISADTIKAVNKAFKAIIRSDKTVEEAATEMRQAFPDVAEVQEMVEFALTSKHGLARVKRK